jgi:phosphoglycerate dehydrogenase-like enzyme
MQALTEISEASKAHSHASKSAERILFAITPSERKQLFPFFDGDSLRSAQYDWANPSVLTSSKEWEFALKELQPTLLMSWWTTPLIPLSWLSTDSLPLRYICHGGGSVRRVVPRKFIADGGIVTNWGNLISHTVAEQALLLILAALRNLPAWHSPSRESLKEDWGNAWKFQTRSLYGKTVGIHGFGNIARELIRLLKPFHVRCMAFSENVPDEYMAAHGVAPCQDLKELFAQNQILVECEALTPKTRGTVTEEHFKLMPMEGVFVNVARAHIVDEQAMERVIAEGRIRVASDVFHMEPLPGNSPLYDCPNMIVSPHIGGPTADRYSRCGDFALQNIARYLAGKPLEAVVTLQVYDRST